MKQKKLISISVLILLSYLSLLLIPLCAVLVIYNMSVNTILDYQHKQTVFSLENTASSLSIRLEELNNIYSYIKSNPAVNAIHNRGSDPRRRDIYQIHQALSSIPSYPLTNQLIRQVVIVFSEAAYVGVPPSGFALNEKTYTDNINFSGISYERLLEMCREKNMSARLTLGEGADGEKELLLLGNIPGSGTLAVLQLDMSALRQILSSNDTGSGGVTCLLDRDGQLLAKAGGAEVSADELRAFAEQTDGSYREVERGGKVYLSYVLHSGGFSYISLVEKGHLLAQAAPVRYIMAALIAAALMLGVLACLALWQRRQRIAKQVEMTARQAGVLTESPRTEGQLYKTTFTNMANTLGTLRKTLDQQRDALRDTVLRNALLGTFGDEADLQADIESTELRFDAEWYYVVNVLLRPGETEKEPPPKQFLGEAMPVDFVACDIDGGSFVLVLPAKDALTPAELKKMFTDLSGKIEDMNWPAPSFAISDGCRELCKLREPYEQTKVIAEYLTCLDRYGVFTVSELPEPGGQMRFTIDSELRFMQLLNMDSPDELENFWRDLIAQNITKRSLPADTLVNMRERLRHCLLRTLSGRPGNDETEALTQLVKKSKSLEGIHQCAVQVQNLLAREISIRDGRYHAEIKTVLQAAVEERFADPGFSLSILADIADIPENTLYRAFKNYFGTSFSSYLEQYRIKKAFELLRGHVPVKDVADRVGYTSDHSFRRAFKRVMKIPPSQFGTNEK